MEVNTFTPIEESLWLVWFVKGEGRKGKGKKRDKYFTHPSLIRKGGRTKENQQTNKILLTINVWQTKLTPKSMN